MSRANEFPGLAYVVLLEWIVCLGKDFLLDSLVGAT